MLWGEDGGNNTKVNETLRIHNREDRLKTNIRSPFIKIYMRYYVEAQRKNRLLGNLRWGRSQRR